MNEVYIGQLANAKGESDGSWVVALFNRTPLPRAMWLELSRLQQQARQATDNQLAPSAWTGLEIWAAEGKRELGTLTAKQTLRRTVAAHDVALFRLDAARPVLKADDSEAWNPYPVRGPFFDITRFGAKGDNGTINTHAFARAFAACRAAGFGYVRVPAGGYRTGRVELASGCYLLLLPGGIVQGSTAQADYGDDWYNSDAFSSCRAVVLANPKRITYVGTSGRSCSVGTSPTPA